MQTQKMFLKKTIIKELDFRNLILGNSISILKWDYLLVDYADNETWKQLDKNQEKIFIILKMDDFNDIVRFFKVIDEH